MIGRPLMTVDELKSMPKGQFTETVFKSFFEWTYGLIYGGISDIFEYIDGTTADIFDFAWVQAFIVFQQAS